MKKSFEIKEAKTEEEKESVYRLNHEIFSLELGQHSIRKDGRKVDKYDNRNIYFIAKYKDVLLGMISINLGCEGPMSIESRLVDKKFIKKVANHAIEIRLLAVVKKKRGSLIALELFKKVYEYMKENNLNYAFISAIDSQLKLYRKLSFKILGPKVQCGKVTYVPMYLDLSEFNPKILYKY